MLLNKDVINSDIAIVTEEELNWLTHNECIKFVYAYHLSHEISHGENIANFFDITMSVVYGVIIFFGVISNLLVFKVVTSVINRKINRVNSVLVYILALTVLNLFIMLSMPMTVLDNALGYWSLPSVFCQLHWLFESMNKSMVSIILSFLTVSCYCAVCHPEMKKIYRSKLWSTINVLFAFALQVAISLPALKNSNIYYFLEIFNDRNLTIVFGRKCLFDPTAEMEIFKFTLCSFTCGYIIPIITMTVCYGSILYTVRYKSPFPRHRTIMFRRVFRSVLFLVCFYLGSWTPYWTVTLVLYIKESKNHGNSESLILIAYIVHLLPYVNCSCSMLIYSLFNEQIRSSLKHPRRK